MGQQTVERDTPGLMERDRSPGWRAGKGGYGTQAERIVGNWTGKARLLASDS
jgi:hypothetical protein